ncbi:MAG: GlcNAc-PI de-N-acetylase [Candidatus Omnitrophica bacterium CG1_02_49_16]|nr:MAG: GlcNAc-PI de-N-acetylase [Candidatus Omnitrophica bacterium CG1_02_49_16]
MKRILVVAPHPDDETLGCAGTLLRHKGEGDQVDWVIVTEMKNGFSFERIQRRDREIKRAAASYRFNAVHRLGFPAAGLDSVPRTKLIEALSDTFRKTSSEVVYLPFRGDVHTDHGAVFEAAISASKWFRSPKIKQIFSYETLSETEFSLSPRFRGFRPNVFIDIRRYLDKKLRIMKIYSGESAAFPFPRSEKAIRALAALRGSSAWFQAAEAFMLLKESK